VVGRGRGRCAIIDTVSRCVTTALVCAVWATVGCGTAASSTLSAHAGRPDSGISGRVWIGPTCPVQRQGQVCTRPYQATLRIERASGGAAVATLRSSVAGRFRVALAPGRYVIVPEVRRPYPTARPVDVTVHAHRYAKVNVNYDSGIR
jgi:hypothetical protein